MAQIDNIPQNEKTLDSLSKINQNFNNLNTDKLEAGSTETLTNKTINAENNTVTELTTASIKTTSKTGQGTKLVTGTNGVAGELAEWNSEGNIVQSNITKNNITLNTDTSVSGNDWVLDEDNFASDSATKVPTQQSVKAYVDNNLVSGGVPDLLRPFQGADDITYAVSTDDIEVQIGATITSNNLMVFYKGAYRRFELSDFGGSTGIRNVSIYNGDIYAYVNQSNTPRLFRINDYKTNVESATITEIDGTTNSFFVGATIAQSMRFAIDVNGNFYFNYGGGSSTNSNVIRKGTITGDTLSAGTDTTYVGTISTFFNFAVIETGDLIVIDTSGGYERFNTGGVSQRYIASGRSATYDVFLSVHIDGSTYIYSTVTNNTDPFVRQEIV